MNRSDSCSAWCRIIPALVLLLAGTPQAWAACYITPGYLEKTVNMSVGRVVIPNDLPVGGAIITPKLFPLPLTGTTNKPWTCVGGGTVIGEMLQGTEVAGYDKVFTTDVPGVGIRLSRYFNGAESTYYPHTRSTTSDFGNFDARSSFQVELIKIARVTGNGPLAQGTYTRYYSPADNKSVLTTILSGVGITIITPSCTVDAGSRNIPVNFGKVTTSSFRGLSSTAGDRNFNIQLNCSAGQNAENTVQIRMDATEDAVKADGVLRITQAAAGTNTAGGIGIQIVNASTKAAVKFGDTVDVGPSKNGSYVLPYTARYYQTGNTVTPGQANGTATFTLDYR